VMLRGSTPLLRNCCRGFELLECGEGLGLRAYGVISVLVAAVIM
jgi:hypothetical protein